MPHDFAPGTVWLVGAGPGDPDLLTRRAERLIRTADIVFHDALVGTGVLDLIPEGVELMGVGKRSGRHSKEQGSINDLIVVAARSGRRVVRLKGGDPSMFGRSTEEIEACRAAGVPVHVCPGVTTASAAAASASVSLSLRGVAQRVQFVTAHARRGATLDLDWTSLADRDSTLAFYMGREAAKEISRSLIAGGLPGSTPVLIACNVSLPDEKLLQTRLDLLPMATKAIASDMPTLLLIGQALMPSRPSSAHLEDKDGLEHPSNAASKALVGTALTVPYRDSANTDRRSTTTVATTTEGCSVPAGRRTTT